MARGPRDQSPSVKSKPETGSQCRQLFPANSLQLWTFRPAPVEPVLATGPPRKIEIHFSNWPSPKRPPEFSTSRRNYPVFRTIGVKWAVPHPAEVAEIRRAFSLKAIQFLPMDADGKRSRRPRVRRFRAPRRTTGDAATVAYRRTTAPATPAMPYRRTTAHARAIAPRCR
jgi:hypothetical protein